MRPVTAADVTPPYGAQPGKPPVSEYEPTTTPVAYDADVVVLQPPLQELTCEVRWIRRGRVGPEVTAWFSQFAPVLEERDDEYLVAPRLPGLSVKIRGGTSFDIKLHGGVVGAVDNAAGAGPVDAWRKISTPLARRADTSQPLDAWQRVGKRRRIALCPGSASEDGESPRAPCSVELTDVISRDVRWWTLGFEARGDGALHAIMHTTGRMLSEPLPGAGPFTPQEARSYGQWIRDWATAL